MIALGVNASSDRAYLAVVRDGHVIDVQPYFLMFAAGLPEAEQVVALKNDALKVLGQHRINRVLIMNAEATYKGSYNSMIKRISMETVIALAASERALDCTRLTRPRVRSILQLGSTGALSSIMADRYLPVGGSWTGKRDLAALAAIAGVQD